METETVRILVCANRRLGDARPSCDGGALADQLADLIAARGAAIRVERFLCFGVCDLGPNLRIAPGGPFFHRVTPVDLPAVLEAAVAFSVRPGPA